MVIRNRVLIMGILIFLFLMIRTCCQKCLKQYIIMKWALK